jgi:hypothetical protein
MGRFSGTNSRLRSPLSDCFSAPTLYVREGGNVFGDGVAQRQLALIDQQHRRDAGDGLGHRKKAKDGVWRDRQLGLHITDAEGLQIDWLPVLLNQDDRSRNFSSLCYSGRFILALGAHESCTGLNPCPVSAF